MTVSYFKAPWSAELKFLSVIASFVLTILSFNMAVAFLSGVTWRIPTLLLVALGPAVLLSSALFTVRGYTLAPSGLLIRRLLWETQLPLTGLKTAYADPGAMKWSLRLFGNGGVFGIVGIFVNRTLGRYRAFATDRTRAVVLDLTNRKVVVTPEDPQQFVAEVQTLFPTMDPDSAPYK